MAAYRSTWLLKNSQKLLYVKKSVDDVSRIGMYLIQCGCAKFSSQSENPYATPPLPTQPRTLTKSEKISKAMKAYLEKAKSFDNKLKEEVAEYEIGKRHLATIMGQDPDSFTQADIDSAIAYLLPSGIFHKRARPLMKHPLELLPNRKAAQFGMDGRPFQFLFYTGKPNYYELMYNISGKIENLEKEVNLLLRKGLLPADSHRRFQTHGSEWLKAEDMKNMLLESISEHHHRRFVSLMDRLVENPLSLKEEDFIMKFRKKLISQITTEEIQKPFEDEDGREYQIAKGKRKHAKAQVKLWINGTGQFSVNGQDILYFKDKIHREQLMYPLQFVNQLGQVDVEAAVEGGGPTGQSGAIRVAIAKALTSFMDMDTTEQMRLAGLLTPDPRQRERKKVGQEGARRKFTWKKR